MFKRPAKSKYAVISDDSDAGKTAVGAVMSPLQDGAMQQKPPVLAELELGKDEDKGKGGDGGKPDAAGPSLDNSVDMYWPEKLQM